MDSVVKKEYFIIAAVAVVLLAFFLINKLSVVNISVLAVVRSGIAVSVSVLAV